MSADGSVDGSLDVVRLAPAEPRDRGRELGSARAEEIRGTVSLYARLFAAMAGRPLDLDGPGAQALAAIRGWAPALAEEIEGIAEGAGLPAVRVAALNARTEVLALAAAQARRGECSTVVVLDGEADGPVATQTWDWHEELAGCFLVLEVEHPDGRTVRTLTEYGIVGKVGVAATPAGGIGLLLNILHHETDGAGIGVPVHVIARRVLDEAADLGHAVALIASARPSASSALTLTAVEGGERAAICAEVFADGPRYVLTDRDGVLLHTNHFLAPEAAVGDRERIVGPDSYVRLGLLQRAVRATSDRVAVRRALSSRLGGGGALCCRPALDAVLGERWTTLATVELDVARAALSIRRGGPTDAVAYTSTLPAPARL